MRILKSGARVTQPGILSIPTGASWTSRKYSRLIRYRMLAAWLALMLSSACSAKPAPPPMQVDGEDAVPSELPDVNRMRDVLAPDYRRAAGLKSECFGRLMFDMKEENEWPVYFDANRAGAFWNRSFSENVRSVGESLRFGSTYIAVLGSVNGTRKEEILKRTPVAIEAVLREMIDENLSYIEEQKREQKDVERARKEIARSENLIRMWEASIKEKREKFEPFDPGVPDSYGYWTSSYEGNDETNLDSTLRAYLTRGEYIYIFESTVKMNTPSAKENHKREFSAMLKTFRTRATNEIPTEPGVCIPYGFIPDDGRTVVEFKQSLRFPDAPGVLYTIETGTVHPRRAKATLLLALANASINPPPNAGDGEARPVVVKRFGPRSVQMGGLKATQGGVWLQAGTGSEQYDIYSIFTGHGGWLGTYVLPYILVDMHTVNREVATEITQPPPPFPQSKERLDTLLKGMRWRPTTPPMAEFEGK